ncbi:NUDIX hydrolase [Nafulsella turpanensis]|uniref:NUDIX hydrolase n=1 Tax=Nafulsella turpanensis TaxID=1265690 RepID=UPI00034D242A|nr:NUDIX hydrolase [Nafulsella turpanensis]
MHWKKLASEYIYQDQWLTVRKDKVALPEGPTIPSYYVLEYPNWVNVIGINVEGELILVRQYRHGLERISYELCAGVSDMADASPLETAKREMLEETGYGGGKWQEWMVVSANPGTHSNLTYCYLATELELVREPELEETEQLTVHLFSVDEVKQLLNDGAIVQALHAAPLWKYLALL